jgi:hypothetical protein
MRFVLPMLSSGAALRCTPKLSLGLSWASHAKLGCSAAGLGWGLGRWPYMRTNTIASRESKLRVYVLFFRC